jgi:hypothetical protein
VSFEELDFETRAVHVGSEPDPTTGSVIPPIYQTSTFAQEEVGRHQGYEYARTGNPTRTRLEACLASLEGVAPGGPGGALCFASGMAATSTVLQTLAPGDHLVLSADVYGGTHRVAARLFAGWGLQLSVVDMTSLDALKQPCGPRPGWSGSRRPPTRCSTSSTSPAPPSWPTPPARCARSTTPLPRRSCSTPWTSAPTWWSTRPPSTWAATPT